MACPSVEYTEDYVAGTGGPQEWLGPAKDICSGSCAMRITGTYTVETSPGYPWTETSALLLTYSPDYTFPSLNPADAQLLAGGSTWGGGTVEAFDLVSAFTDVGSDQWALIPYEDLGTGGWVLAGTNHPNWAGLEEGNTPPGQWRVYSNGQWSPNAHAVYTVSWIDTETGEPCEATAPPGHTEGPEIIDIHDPDGEFIATMERLTDWSLRVEDNAPGYITFTINRYDEQADETLLAPGNIIRVTIPQISEYPLAEFLLEDGDFDLISSDEEGGEDLQFGGPGSLKILSRAIIDYQHYTGTDVFLDVANGVWHWTTETAGDIMRRMIVEAIARDVLSGVTRTFADEDDSSGTPWSPEIPDWIAPIGSNLYDEVIKILKANGLHIRMDPGLFLHAWQDYAPDKTGTDFGADVVRFVKGINISSDLKASRAARVYASRAVARGTDGDYEEATLGSPEFVREVFLEVQSNSDTIVEMAAEESLGARADAQQAMILEVVNPPDRDAIDVDAGLYLPCRPTAPDVIDGMYWIGDLVTLHTGTTGFEHKNNETVRIHAITLRPDATGALAPPVVELNAPYVGSEDEFGDALSPGQGGSTGNTSGGSGGGSGGGTGPHTHTQYQTRAEKGQDDGYVGLDGAGLVASADLGTGGAGAGAKVLADNQTWITPSAGVTDHGALTGLSDDDHPQYATNTEFDDHSARHQTGGADAIKLDDFAAPDDNTDLNATTSAHGLLPKLGGGTTNFLRADGTWNAPPGGGGDLDDLTDVDAPSPADGDVLTWDAGGSEWIAAAPTGGGGSGGAGGPGAATLVQDTFVGDGVEDTFTLSAEPGAAIVTVNGVQVLLSEYTITTDQLVFDTAPDDEAEILVTFVEGGEGGGSVFEPAPDPNADDDEGDVTDTDPISGWSTLGSPTTLDRNTTVADHIWLVVPANASLHVLGLYRAHTMVDGEAFVAKVSAHSIRAADNRLGVFISTSGTAGRIDLIGRHSGGWNALAFTNPTSFSSDFGNGAWVDVGTSFLAIRRNSATSWDFLTSNDGFIWVKRVSARNPSFTQADVGLFAQPQNGSTALHAAFDWARFYAALPGVVI